MTISTEEAKAAAYKELQNQGRKTVIENLITLINSNNREYRDDDFGFLKVVLKSIGEHYIVDVFINTDAYPVSLNLEISNDDSYKSVYNFLLHLSSWRECVATVSLLQFDRLMYGKELENLIK